jgi:UDP-N-acetylglucosamine transferase subunit ALG13
MMEALAGLPASRLHVQHGPVAPPECAEAYPFLPFSALVEKMEQADVVVSHAGVGSIMCALRAGHTPIIFPRLKRYAETVDDHQLELSLALAERGTAIVARSAAELVSAVAAVPERRPAAVLTPSPLATAVRAAVRGEPLVQVG